MLENAHRLLEQNELEREEQRYQGPFSAFNAPACWLRRVPFVHVPVVHIPPTFLSTRLPRTSQSTPRQNN